MLRLPNLVIAVGLCVSLQGATFTITHMGTPADAQVAIQYAADIWGGILESEVPIKVTVIWFPLGSSTLGITFPNGRKDFTNAPVPETWYATALANSIAGSELNAGEEDINVYLNQSTNWYTGTDGNTPPGQYDLVSVALHELGHGLGFVGLAKKVDTEGSLGLLEASDFAPLITTFPWPDQDTLPGIFDRFLTSTANGPLIMLENPSDLLGTAFTSNQVYFSGASTMAANSGQPARIYAPATFALGSSCVHLNEASYPAGNANELMTPFSSAGHSNHWPGPICIGAMRDIGWTVTPEVGIHEYISNERLSAFPNPAHEQISFMLNGRAIRGPISITDMSGRILRSVPATGEIDVHDLAPGTYFATITGRAPVRFVKD